MKVTTRETITTTEIECTADELRQSNTLSDAFTGALRRALNGGVVYTSSEESEEEETNED